MTVLAMGLPVVGERRNLGRDDLGRKFRLAGAFDNAARMEDWNFLLR
jgi:hypothetical protein